MRAAVPGDLEDIVEFQRELALETEGIVLDPETLRDGVDAVLIDPARGRYWMAEADGRSVGCLLVVAEWSDWRNGAIWWVHSLYVHPDYRRQGVFQALYGHLRDAVEATDELKGLRLCVAPTNQPARQAYEAVGMEKGRYVVYEWLQNPDEVCPPEQSAGKEEATDE